MKPEVTFVIDLENTIEKLDELSRRQPSQSYKPSSLNCVRMMYFEMTATPRDPGSASTNLIGICESGEDRHKRLQAAISKMQEMGYDCEFIDVETYIKENDIPDLKVVRKEGFETKLFHEKLCLSFMCDGLIRYQGRLYILEIKTESIHRFQSRSGVAIEHFSQGAAYAVALLVDAVLYLYENRDNCSKKAYIFEATKELKEKLVHKKIRDCNDYIKTKVIPPKHKMLLPKICDNCDYKEACKHG